MGAKLDVEGLFEKSTTDAFIAHLQEKKGQMETDLADGRLMLEAVEAKALDLRDKIKRIEGARAVLTQLLSELKNEK